MDGTLIAQNDGPPMGIPAARLAWPGELRLVDLRRIQPASAELASVLVGAYNFASGERFPAVGAAGQPLKDQALSLNLQDDCSLDP